MQASAGGHPQKHIVSEIRMAMTFVGDELHGTAAVHPELCVPGTTALRTSILAMWADHVAGLLVSQVMAPRVPVTLDLDIHLERVPATRAGRPSRRVGAGACRARARGGPRRGER